MIWVAGMISMWSKIKTWLRFQWPEVNDCKKCNGTGVIYTKCECQTEIKEDK